MSSLESRYREVLSKIESPSKVTLLAVSKMQSVDAIEELYRLGHRDFGENYVQELVTKAQELKQRGCDGIRWHFIGHLQTNKVKQLIPYVYAIHTIDSEKLANELARRWKESCRPGKLLAFLEVNIDHEPSKAGFPPEQVQTIAKAIAKLPELSIQGLMCIPAPAIPEQSKQAFGLLRNLEKSCQPLTQGYLSMGMSSDYPIAISEGATHIRVGTALFGTRSHP